MNARSLVYLCGTAFTGAACFIAGYAFARYVDEHQPAGPNNPCHTGDPSMSDPATSPQVRLGTAVDRVTSAFAAECRRIAAALANANSHTNQIDIDPQIAGLNKLADLMDGTNETNILTYAANPAVISTPVSPSPGDPLAAGQPVNTSGNTASASPTGQATNTSEVGVSDSNNPADPLSPAPLGTPQPVIQGTGAPTDAVVAGNAGINEANSGATAPNASPTGATGSQDATTASGSIENPTASPIPEGSPSLDVEQSNQA